MVAGEVFRGRYRESFSIPQPIVPGQVNAYEISLRSRHHTFKAGHRIMVADSKQLVSHDRPQSTDVGE